MVDFGRWKCVGENVEGISYKLAAKLTLLAM